MQHASFNKAVIKWYFRIRRSQSLRLLSCLPFLTCHAIIDKHFIAHIFSTSWDSMVFSLRGQDKLRLIYMSVFVCFFLYPYISFWDRLFYSNNSNLCLSQIYFGNLPSSSWDDGYLIFSLKGYMSGVQNSTMAAILLALYKTALCCLLGVVTSQK